VTASLKNAEQGHRDMRLAETKLRSIPKQADVHGAKTEGFEYDMDQADDGFVKY
jgi:hypothetical protein